ncbi:probable plastid-lipid-associated protein 8, chloroplastic [Olea europaea var. sylvestris]|uniref:probable plastid-lipid-associated protein 8, chloroplastic n=1 Tax=Olea europaea var. sylvestris TaxID=158386 RepID=UPI000C1D669D|nr:probable plastid-lipid-associated protein 8, chloroplastic [Olea europaea var. sylvestris]
MWCTVALKPEINSYVTTNRPPTDFPGSQFRFSIYKNKSPPLHYTSLRGLSMAIATSASTALVILPQLFTSTSNCRTFPLHRRWSIKTDGGRIYASVSAATSLPTRPDDLVASIVSKVMQTDRGVLLARDEHQKVAAMATELQKFCVDEPVKCPLIFGEWDVLYCSNPTSPGGGYRSSIGRLFLKTNDMIQVVEAHDIVRNRVSFSILGLLEGEVSLKGKLTALDKKWIQVVFEPPELKVGGLEFTYGGKSEVKLEITYIDEKIRLGKGSRGSLFVFQRRKPIS